MVQYQSGNQTRRIAALTHSGPTVQMHPDLARAAGIARDDIVAVRTRRGRAHFRAVVDEKIRPDTLFVPFHWGGASSANALTDPALDPLSRMPAFKACAATAERIGGPDDDHLLTTRPASLPIRPVVLPTPADPPQPPEVNTGRISQHSPNHRRKDIHMPSKNRFLQGIFEFQGLGIDKPAPLDDSLVYVVPDGSIAQALYFRGGNTSDELVAVVLMKDGVADALLPDRCQGRRARTTAGGARTSKAAPRSSCTSPLRQGLTGSVVVDVGLVEV